MLRHEFEVTVLLKSGERVLVGGYFECWRQKEINRVMIRLPRDIQVHMARNCPKFVDALAHHHELANALAEIHTSGFWHDVSRIDVLRIQEPPVETVAEPPSPEPPAWISIDERVERMKRVHALKGELERIDDPVLAAEIRRRLEVERMALLVDDV